MSIQLPIPPRPSAKNRSSLMWWIGLLQLATLALMLFWLLSAPGSSLGQASAELPKEARAVASKLKAAGALDEASALYERYLNHADLDPAIWASIAFSLGQLYLEQGKYEKALRWFYQAEAQDSQELKDKLGKKIVHALEALGRVHAAKAVLDRETRLGSETKAGTSSDPVVARIGPDTILRSDIVRALDDLPPFFKERFKGETGQREFLSKYVADELIFRKAKKLEYDADPEVRRQLEALIKQLVVNRFIEKEVLGKIEITPTDLKNHYQAHREKFKEPDRVRLRLIKLASSESAANLVGQIRSGADFAALAKKHSLDQATRKGGGLLERFVQEGENFLEAPLAEENLRQIFATPEKQVTDPLPIGEHTYLFKIEEKRLGKALSFEQAEKQIQNDYRFTKSQAAYAELIQETLSAEDVELFPQKMETNP